MRIRLAITLDLESRRERNAAPDREVQLDALVETRERDRIGFTMPGPTREDSA